MRCLDLEKNRREIWLGQANAGTLPYVMITLQPCWIWDVEHKRDGLIGIYHFGLLDTLSVCISFKSFSLAI